MRRRPLYAECGPGPPCKCTAKIDPSAPLRAAPAPVKHGGGLEHWRSKQRAKKRSTLDPARRPRKRAPVSLRLGSLGEGLAGGWRPFCSVGGMCCEDRGLIGAKEHLVVLPPWCARAPRAQMPSPACARKGRNGVLSQLQGREGVLGGREGTPISANLPRFCPTPVSPGTVLQP